MGYKEKEGVLMNTYLWQLVLVSTLSVLATTEYGQF